MGKNKNKSNPFAGGIELSAAEMVAEAESKTKTKIDDEIKPVDDGLDKELIEKNKIDLSGMPTKKKINAQFKDDKDKALHCVKWAENNGHVFLGFAIMDGEPMFKKLS